MNDRFTRFACYMTRVNENNNYIDAGPPDGRPWTSGEEDAVYSSEESSEEEVEAAPTPVSRVA